MELGFIMIVPVLLGAMAAAVSLVWWERRLLGFWQDRLGPNRIGPGGSLQIIADAVKLITKHDWVPPFSDRVVFTLAPTAAVAGMLMGFAVVPFGPGLFIIDLNIGVLFFLAMTSLAVYSVLLGGLASNSKYSLIGGLHSAAQMVTYEVFGSGDAGVVMQAGSFNLSAIVTHKRVFGFVYRPLGLVIFLIAGVAETHRAVRSAGSRTRTCCRVSHRIFGHEVRPAHGRRISVDGADVGDDRDAVLRRLARLVLLAADRLVHAQNRIRHLLLHSAARQYSAAAL
jgi:NADH:ubiquinone oxidoreductase subunit H